LFIAGPEDIAVPLTDLEQQAKIPGRSYFHIMDNVGHMGMLESPKQMNQYLSAFIQATF
jgi:pimeloyl-ACP methyl ester carboxylesterase